MHSFVAAIASATLLGLGLYCHRNWRSVFPEDEPSAAGRHRHAAPTPMVGFVPAVVALFGLATITPCGWLLAGVFVATVIGYFDDRGKAEDAEMAWHIKAMGLLVASALATTHLSLQLDLSLFPILAVFCWLFAMTNSVNFLDNTDGVATATAATGLCLTTAGSGPLAFAGFAFLGFLLFNWPRPHAFLGDSGSLSLGLCLAAACAEYGWANGSAADGGTVGWTVLLFAVVPASIFALDFTQVILARLILGVPPWEGDRRHLTHILDNLGVPKVLIAPLFAGLVYGGFTALVA